MGRTGPAVGLGWGRQAGLWGRGEGGCITSPDSRRNASGTEGLCARGGANAQAQEGSCREGPQGLHAPKSFLTM